MTGLACQPGYNKYIRILTFNHVSEKKTQQQVFEISSINSLVACHYSLPGINRNRMCAWSVFVSEWVSVNPRCLAEMV